MTKLMKQCYVFVLFVILVTINTIYSFAATETINGNKSYTADESITLDANSNTNSSAHSDWGALFIAKNSDIDLGGHELTIDVDYDSSISTKGRNEKLYPTGIIVGNGNTVNIHDGTITINLTGDVAHRAYGILNDGKLTLTDVTINVTGCGNTYALYSIGDTVTNSCSVSASTTNASSVAYAVYSGGSSGTTTLNLTSVNGDTGSSSGGSITVNNVQSNVQTQTSSTQTTNTTQASTAQTSTSQTSTTQTSTAQTSTAQTGSTQTSTVQATEKSWYLSPHGYSGEWKKDDKGWWYQLNNGSFLTGASSGVTSPRRIGTDYYAFDQDGYMLTEWVDEFGNRCTEPEGWKYATYYFGPDGAMALNCWKQILVTDYDTQSEDRDYWFYFDGKGQKVHNTESTNYKERVIDKVHYAFADDGHMLTGWQFMGDATDPESDASFWQYFGSDVDMTGAMLRTGWFKAIPPAGLDATGYDNEAEHWFYAKSGGHVVHGMFYTINNKKYLFNFNGSMVDGLRWVDVDTDGSLLAVSPDLKEDSETLDALMAIYPDGKGLGASGFYYFGTDGAAKSGKKTFTVDGQKKKVECR